MPWESSFLIRCAKLHTLVIRRGMFESVGQWKRPGLSCERGLRTAVNRECLVTGTVSVFLMHQLWEDRYPRSGCRDFESHYTNNWDNLQPDAADTDSLGEDGMVMDDSVRPASPLIII